MVPYKKSSFFKDMISQVCVWTLNGRETTNAFELFVNGKKSNLLNAIVRQTDRQTGRQTDGWI